MKARDIYLKCVFIFFFFQGCYSSPSYEDFQGMTEDIIIYEIEKSTKERIRATKDVLEKEKGRLTIYLLNEYKNVKRILNTIMTFLFGGCIGLVLDNFYGEINFTV